MEKCFTHKTVKDPDGFCYLCNEEQIARAEAGQIKAFHRNSGDW